MVLSLPRTMPPIDESIRSSPIGPRLTAAMAKLAETIAKYYPDSTSYTPPPPNESMDTLADVMAKLEIASKRLATSTAHLISITAKTTTLNYTATRTESKDDTINNTFFWKIVKIMTLTRVKLWSGSPNTSALTNGASHDLNEAAWLKVGVLLSGPPGNGKMLFAQTLAKESEMPFMFASGAEFTDSEKSGAARINKIFLIARPAFIFKRETGVDRFSLRQAVIFICATNRPDELDLEFVQAGCINRRLYIGLPDAKQRVQISDVHNIGKQLAEDVEFENLRSSPKVNTSSPLVSPSSIINVPRELYSIDVAATFGVPLTTVGDLQKLINDIDAGKHDELLSELTNEDRMETLEALGSICNSIKVDRNNADVIPCKVSYADDSINLNVDESTIPSDPIVQSVDINKLTSYAGVAGGSAKDQPNVNSNFRTLVADPVFDGVNISIPRKVVEKVSTRFEHTLYGYFIGKRMAFSVVEYYARNNWAKHGLKRIMMNSKGFFFFKFDSRAGLEAVLEGGPWLIRKSPIILKKWSMDTRLLKEELTRIPIWVKLHDVPIQVFEEDGISLIATFIGKPVMLDSYTSSMCNDSWGRSSFARCLIEVNSEADLVDVVTIGIPSLSEDDFTKETIRVEYEWRPPRCDTCKIFGHVHDYCPKKVVSPPIVATSNVVTPNAEKTNDGFQTVGKKKKRKGKSKSTNGGQFTGPSVKHNVRYEPKATTSAPKKGTTYVGYTSQSTPMLKMTGNSSKKDNLSMSNSFSALNEEEEEDVENVYDESANLIQNTKAGGSSSFTAAAG
ncbi:zinc knuckle CX2CX4HX4C containing protein [Tanacetum coccineum]